MVNALIRAIQMADEDIAGYISEYQWTNSMVSLYIRGWIGRVLLLISNEFFIGTAQYVLWILLFKFYHYKWVIIIYIIGYWNKI